MDARYRAAVAAVLYRSFSERGNPTLKTMLSVMKALGLERTTRVAHA
jgi:DNA-binding phage protein